MWKICRASLTLSSPIQTVRNGFSSIRRQFHHRLSHFSWWSHSLGSINHQKPSTFGSAIHVVTANSYLFTSASPSMSTGLPWLQYGGSLHSSSVSTLPIFQQVLHYGSDSVCGKYRRSPCICNYIQSWSGGEQSRV